MKLTKSEAVRLHRKMWNWIADETEKRKEKGVNAEMFDEGITITTPINKNTRTVCDTYFSKDGEEIVSILGFTERRREVWDSDLIIEA